MKDSDGIEHKKCMNGLTSQCPFNYNSYIYVNTNATSDNYGDIELHERGSANGNPSSTASAQCFGYSTTTSSTGTRTTTSSSDPYYNLRGPVADARRSIMQKYLLDANAACDVYGESLTNTAQNINYQKVAAQQALQQKRLEFKQQEDSETKSNYKTYASNFVSCLDELLECYENYSDQGWADSRIKTYCAQKSNVQHCYEPMVCSPSRLGLEAVIDKPDNPDSDGKCTFSQDFRKNTCRNVVTISEILYKASTKEVVDLDTLTYSTDSSMYSDALREACLVAAGVDDIRGWSKDAPDTVPCSMSEVQAVWPQGATGRKGTTDTKCKYLTSCVSGYSVETTTSGSTVTYKCEPITVTCNKNDFVYPNLIATVEAEYADGVLQPCKITECVANYTPNASGTQCVAEVRDYCEDTSFYANNNAATARSVYNGSAFVCEVVDCISTEYGKGKKDNGSITCLKKEKECTDSIITAGTQTLDETTGKYGTCKASACASEYSLNAVNGTCWKTTESCSIQHGTGQKTWSNGDYGDCTVKECTTNYHEESNSCVSDKSNDCPVTDANATVYEKVWNESSNQWGACKIIGCKSGYTVSPDGTSCVDVSSNP